MLIKSKVKQIVTENNKILTTGAFEALEIKVKNIVVNACRGAGGFKRITAQDIMNASGK